MVAAQLNTSLYAVKGFILLDSDGKRLLAKYYAADSPSTLKEQQRFEKSLFEKAKKTPKGEIMVMDKYVAVFRNNVDVFFYVVGGTDENELILSAVMNAFYDALAVAFKGQVDRRMITENLDIVFLALDETIDNGIPLEMDASVIAQRVAKRGVETNDSPFSEQSITQALQNARDQLARSLLK